MRLTTLDRVKLERKKYKSGSITYMEYQKLKWAIEKKYRAGSIAGGWVKPKKVSKPIITSTISTIKNNSIETLLVEPKTIASKLKTPIAEIAEVVKTPVTETVKTPNYIIYIIGIGITIGIYLKMR